MFLTTTALLSTIALGSFTHGEPRFIFMPLMAMLLVGGQALAVLLSRLRASPRRIVMVGLTVVIAFAFTSGVARMHNALASTSAARDVIVGAADAVRSDAGQVACSIRSSYVPQLTWYAACSTFTFTDGAPSADDPSYLVLFLHLSLIHI